MRMPPQSLFVSFALIVVALACARQAETPAVDISEARKGIDAGNAGIARWAAAGQADSIADIYTTDALAFPTGMAPIRGREAIRAFWKQVFAGGSAKFTANTDDVEGVGDKALEHGKWAIDFTRLPTAPAGSMNSFNDHGHYLTYWVKDGGRWLIKWDAGVSEIAVPPK